MRFSFLLFITLVASFSCTAQTSGVTTGDTTHVQTYLFAEFKDGYVLMKSGTVEPAQLNYDTFDHQIVFSQGGGVMVLSDLSQVDTAYFAGRKFIPVKKNVYELVRADKAMDLLLVYDGKIRPKGASAGHDGTSRKSQGEVMGSISGTNLSRSRFQSDYDLEIVQTFYVKRFNHVYRLTSNKAVLKAVPESLTAQTRTYLDGKEVDFHNLDEVTALFVAIIADPKTGVENH